MGKILMREQSLREDLKVTTLLWNSETRIYILFELFIPIELVFQITSDLPLARHSSLVYKESRWILFMSCICYLIKLVAHSSNADVVLDLRCQLPRWMMEVGRTLVYHPFMTTIWTDRVTSLDAPWFPVQQSSMQIFPWASLLLHSSEIAR